ncbi:NAD(P)/FAD-dependent oxidoreductase [Dyadobacter sp. UP-52]|uniref:NADH:ubiquinone reductase (non-electrogenic) n=2 Tax=Dyadobacter subterraneus TaxID=2773304 RepID=A0ABR9W772_9BACT|nr:NAD(P)/FAD-dependent oxidoreductase [Dyadobacter subterraneus]
MENSIYDEKHVIVIGGGFAGINFAQQILKNPHYQITLIDKNNYNYFPPLLYQVATSFLDPASISYPFRKLLRGKRIRFRMGEVSKIDTEKRTVFINDDPIQYDFLVFATGAKINYFGNNSIEKNALPMKTIDDALRMRNELLKTLEMATVTQDAMERKKLLNVVVAGGGPTGVEISGMLAELKKFMLTKDYPELKENPGNIYVIDGGKNLLAQMSQKSQQRAYLALSQLGVKIKLSTRVLDFENDIIRLSTGEVIASKTLIWAAGITANTFEGIPETSLGKGKRMITDQFNKVIGIDYTYAIGDSSIQTLDRNYPDGHPQLAQVAIQQGLNLAKNFNAMSKGEESKAFRYNDKGDMAIIGKSTAVVDLFKKSLFLHGFIALLVWLLIHLISLVNYRIKLRTLWNWFEAYVSRDQSLRTIFRS